MVLLTREGDAWELLGEALREYGLDYVPAVARTPLGKPFFPDRPGLHFNLSHSGPYAICAVGEREVGVDIEAVRPRNAALPKYALTDEEYRWYEAHGGDWDAFYTLWTRKESFCKRTGSSIARPRAIRPPLPGEDCKGISLTSLSGPGWRAAVCAADAF